MRNQEDVMTHGPAPARFPGDARADGGWCGGGARNTG